MAAMSTSHFYRRFRKFTGSTPIDWLRRERISQAKRRLIECSDSIAEIAEQVGYSDQFYFSRDFRRFTGLSPSYYRRQELGSSKPKRRSANGAAPPGKNRGQKVRIENSTSKGSHLRDKPKGRFVRAIVNC